MIGQVMQIVVTRVDAHRYSTIVKRDGLQIRVPGYAFMRPLPHDLAHCVVEATLGLTVGFGAASLTEQSSVGWKRLKGGEGRTRRRKRGQPANGTPTILARPSG